MHDFFSVFVCLLSLKFISETNKIYFRKAQIGLATATLPNSAAPPTELIDE